MEEESIIKARIKEAIRLTETEYRSIINSGGSPTIVSFDHLLGKIMSQVGKDPRFTEMKKKDIKAYAEGAYRDMAKKIGQSGIVATDPAALRGYEVFVTVQIVDRTLEINVYADEKMAVGIMNKWFTDMDAGTTIQQIEEWRRSAAAAPKEGPVSPHPLGGTKLFGSGVFVHPIQ